MNETAIAGWDDVIQGFDVDLPSHRLTYNNTVECPIFLIVEPQCVTVSLGDQQVLGWQRDYIFGPFLSGTGHHLSSYGNNHIFWNGFASLVLFTRTIILGFSDYFIYFGIHFWNILQYFFCQETHFTMKEGTNGLTHNGHLYITYIITHKQLPLQKGDGQEKFRFRTGNNTLWCVIRYVIQNLMHSVNQQPTYDTLLP